MLDELCKGRYFIDIRDGNWYTIDEVHKQMKHARDKVKSILDRDGNDTPVRIRDWTGGVVWTNVDLIGR